MAKKAVLPKGALLERITIMYKVDGRRKYTTCKLLPPFDTTQLALGDSFEIKYQITKEVKHE